MTFILAYWIAVAALGLFAGAATLRRSLRARRRVRETPPDSLPEGITIEDLLEASRHELLRDIVLTACLSLNLAVGLVAAIPHESPVFKAVTGAVSLLGILGVATLLSLYAIINYWLRTR